MQRRLDLFFQGDADEDADRQADGICVDQRGLAPDDAGFLQPRDPAQTRAGRQADGAGEIDIGQASVILQGFENSAIYRI